MQPTNEHQTPPSSAFALLQQPQKFRTARADSSSFLRKLADDTIFFKDLLDICLRPSHFQTKTGLLLTPDMPALAVDALTTLYEDFINLLAYGKLLPKNQELQGFQYEQQESSEMIPENQEQAVEQFANLSHIHRGLEQLENETAYSYMSRLLGPLFYQKPGQLFRFYEIKPEMMVLLLSRLNNRGVMQIFCKMLEAQSGKQFFKDYKFRYLSAYYQTVVKELQGGQGEEWLECLLQLHKFITEKIEEKYDGTTYLTILKSIEEWDLEIIMLLSSKMRNYSDQFCLLVIKWIEELLKHDNYVMGSTTIKLSLTFANRKNSISNNFYSEEKRDHKKKAFNLSDKHLLSIANILHSYEMEYINNDEKAMLSQHLITFYRCLYFYVRIWVHNILEKRVKDPAKIAVLINQTFLDRTFRIIHLHPKSTILHNYIKQLLIECLKGAIIKSSYFLNPENRYRELLLSSLPVRRNAQGLTFSNQIYHIYKEILSLNQHNPEIEDIEPLLMEQAQRVSKVIGGDPRKLNSDNLRGSNNAFSESSEQVEFDLYSHGNFTVGGSLNRSNPSPIRSFTFNSSEALREGTILEERITIEGIEEDERYD